MKFFSPKIAVSFLIVLLLVMLQLPLFGQVEKPATQKAMLLDLLSEDMDSTMLAFIESENFLGEIDLATILPFEEWRALLIKNNQQQSKQGRISTEIILQSLFINNALADSFQVDLPTNYNNILVSSKIKVGAIPIILKGRVVTSDSKIQKKLSNFSIDFDPLEHLNQFKEKYQPNPTALLQNINTPDFQSINQLGAKNNLPALKEKDKSIIRNEVKFQLYQHLITQPKFMELVSKKEAMKGELSEKQDSISGGLEELATKNQAIQSGVKSKTDSLKNRTLSQADSLSMKVKEEAAERKMQADSLLTLYNECWENRKNYYGDTLQVLKEKLSAYALKIDQYNNPETIRKNILADKEVSLINRFLAASKKIAIGQSIIDDSWYTAKSLPINGIQYQYNSGNIYGTLAYGKQVFNTSFSPVWSSKLFNQLEGGNVLMLQGGYEFGEDKSRLEYTYIRLKETGNFSNGIVLAPKNNAVFSIIGEGKVTNGLQLKTNLAYSRSIWGRTDLSISNKINATNTAAEITLESDLDPIGLTMEVGYFYVGANFIAAANPFLQNNQHGLVTKVEGRIGNKLDLAGELKMGKSLDAAILGGNQKSVLLLGSINWQPTPQLSISGQIAPNTFKHFGTGAIAINGANMLYNLQLTSQHQLRETTLLLTGGYTNYNAQWQYFDTTLVNKTNQFFIQNSLVLPNQSNLSLMAMVGFNTDNQNEVKSTQQNSFLAGLDYQFTVGKWNTSAGVQLLKDAFVREWFYGITSTNQWEISSQLALMVDFSWQIPKTQNDQTKPRYWGAIELIKRF